jgi:tRNA (pseudouridine54-N1)-methyltransferase
MDLMCRSVSAAFFLSHDLRRDVIVYLVLLGEPNPPRAIKISGRDVKYMSPDERNIAGLIRKALGTEDIDDNWDEATPGIEVSSKGLEAVLAELSKDDIFYLREDGRSIEEVSLGKDAVFVLGDHFGLTDEQEKGLEGRTRLSLGELSYHTDHCITVVNHRLDKGA